MNQPNNFDLMNKQITLELFKKRTDEAFFEGYASASLVIKRFVKTLIKQEETEIKEYRPHCDEEYYCIKSRIDALKLVLAFINAPDDEELQ